MPIAGVPPAHVRVLGTRLNRFIEFEYSLGDGELSIELILPVSAFEEFCRTQQADVTPSDPGTAEEVEMLAWRSGQPGLLRKPLQDG